MFVCVCLYECYGLKNICSFIMNSILKTNGATITPHSIEMVIFLAHVFSYWSGHSA